MSKKETATKPRPGVPRLSVPFAILGILILALIVLVIVMQVRLATMEHYLASCGCTGKQEPETLGSHAGDPVKGERDAPVEIVEFSEFECPFCGKFYAQTLPLIEENYLATGKAKLVYKDFPLSFHRNAQHAAEAAACAHQQNQFWTYHDRLFETEQLEITSLYHHAEALGLNMEAFRSCLENRTMMDSIQKNIAEGRSLGVSGTPTFFINGKKIVGAQPYAAFEAAIEEALS